MRTAFKWRLDNYNYVYITDETNIYVKDGMSTIGDPFIYNTLTTSRKYDGKECKNEVDDDKISEIVSNIDKSTYTEKFAVMEQLVWKNNYKIVFQSSDYYFNLNENSCASSVSNQIQGPQGLMGPQGEKGSNGADGAQGPQGEKGERGVQGPKGDGGSGSVTHGGTKIIYRRSSEPLTINDVPTDYKIVIDGFTFTDNEGKWFDNDPGTTTGENLWISFGSFTWSNEQTEITEGVNWGKPADCSGEPGTDSGGYHFIYYRTNTELNVTGYKFNPEKYNPEVEKTQGQESGKEWVDWTESPQGIESNQRFEYMAVSNYDSDTKEWSNWVGPVMWARWGENGTDGDGVEYIYCSAKEGTQPFNPTPKDYLTNENYQSKTSEFIPGSAAAGNYTTIDDNSITAGAIPDISGGTWNDEPKGTTEEYPYEYVSIRKYRTHTDGTKKWLTFSAPKIWSTDSSIIGKTLSSKIIYPMGEWNENTNYTGNTSSAPYVTYNNKLYVLVATNSQGDTPSEHPKIWKEGGTQQDITWTKLLLADNALVGQAVFNGSYMFSQSGITASGEATNNYSKFNKIDPFNANNEFRPNYCVDLVNGIQWVGAGKIKFNYDGSGFLASENLWWDKDGNLYGSNAEFKGIFTNNVTHLTAKNRNTYLIKMGNGQTSTKKYESGTENLSIFGNAGTCTTLTWEQVFNEAEDAYAFSINMQKLNGTFVFHENTPLIISFPVIHYIGDGEANDVSFNPMLKNPNGGYRPCNINDLNSFLNTIVTFKNESSVDQMLVLYGDIRSYNENGSIEEKYIDETNTLLGRDESTMADVIGLATNDEVTLKFIKENNGYRWEVINHGTEEIESPAFFADEESNSYFMPRNTDIISGYVATIGGTITSTSEAAKTNIGFSTSDKICTMLQSCEGYRCAINRTGSDGSDTLIDYSSHEFFEGTAKETGIAIEPDAIGCDFQVVSPYYDNNNYAVVAQLIFTVETGDTSWKSYVYTFNESTSIGDFVNLTTGHSTPDISKNYWLFGGISGSGSKKAVNRFYHIDFNKLTNFTKGKKNYINVNYAYYNVTTSSFVDVSSLSDVMENTRPILIFDY